jgi:hypothetical protein
MVIPKIGVFGWYMHGNFGDEIMAIMIGRTLKSQGYRPVLYKLPRYLADAEALESVDTLDALTDGAAACVLGGGGLLVSAAETMTPALSALDDELSALAVLCASRSVPVWGVSLGGTGAGRQAKLYPGLARLLGSGVVRGITLRLEQDRPLIDAFDIPSEHYPDMVFLAPDYWPARHADEPRRIVATNKIAAFWPGRRLIHFLDRFGPSVLGVEPRHVATRNAAYSRKPPGAFVGRADCRVPYESVQQFSDLLPRVRAIVSSKLHLGIFGMAYGAVFFSYGGKEKTRAQLRELGLASHILSTRDLGGWVVRLRAGLSGELESMATLVPALRTRACKHVTALLAFVHAEAAHGPMPATVSPDCAAAASRGLQRGGVAA